MAEVRIETKDNQGKPNGYVLTLWNIHEQAWTPDQVYLTVIAPGCSKGPHLHKKRCGRFLCIQGNVTIIMRRYNHPQAEGLYYRYRTGEEHGYALVEVPPGTPVQLVNDGDEPAFVINMPSPAWRRDEPDEWPVENWNP